MNPAEERIADILAAARTIAVVGLSSSPRRASHRIAAYLQGAGYRIIPVNPRAGEILGAPARPSLDAVEEAVDIVNIFRRAEFIPRLAAETLRRGRRPSAFWMQEGIVHDESARLLEREGICVMQDLCIKTAHSRLRADGLLSGRRARRAEAHFPASR